jgi:cyclomaltodextrinase / maltogenic alpha-amylase / neopullulanase
MKLMHLARATFVAFAAVSLMAACGDDDDPVDPGNGTVNHTFTYVKPAGAPAVTSVNLAGSFNNWSTTAQAMTQQPNGSWTATIPLAKGTYQYKFVMNGNTWPGNMCNDATWGNPKVDASVTTCVDDGNGGQNAVLVIE